jgi:hypothetical protein
MKVKRRYLQGFLGVLTLWLAGAAQLSAQALYEGRLANGTTLLVVAEPLADATTVAWPQTGLSREGAPVVVTSGDLTLVADVEEAFSGDDMGPAPPVVVAVGGAAVPDLRALFDRLFADRTADPARNPGLADTVEGRLDRRLGVAGSDAELRLEVHLPPPEDPRRSSVEVLWDVLPELLADGLAGVRSRIDGHFGLLEARTEADSADFALRQLRLALARIAENPDLEPAAVARSSDRLRVRRLALLERHPEAAIFLLDVWLTGGSDAVREYLFGIDGVTVEGVREAARRWLPQHPGNVTLLLPPRTLNPRFAAPPRSVQLSSGAAAAVLERSGMALATLCMRPVMVPDLDMDSAATVLARLARELREHDERPGWIWVNSEPPQIELAVPADRFAELSEALRAALEKVTDDLRPVVAGGGSARQRALRLMAGLLGVAEGSALSPAALLRDGNLALGIVAEDGEAAEEALRKFWAVDERRSVDAAATVVAPVPRTREAVAGAESVIVVNLELAAVSDEVVVAVLADLLHQRGSELLPGTSVEILQPFVPGHRVLLVVATADLPMDALEAQLSEVWDEFTATVAEDDLVDGRRRVASVSAAAWSGITGRARRCSAVAAGAARWRAASELEMATLSVSADELNAIIREFSDWENLPNTGAGVLPIVEIGDR